MWDRAYRALMVTTGVLFWGALFATIMYSAGAVATLVMVGFCKTLLYDTIMAGGAFLCVCISGFLWMVFGEGWLSKEEWDAINDEILSHKKRP